MVQNILFDLDETLLDFKRSESRALSNMLRHIGVEPTEKVISRYSEINKSRWKLLEQGLLTRQQVKESRYEILFAELGVEYSAAEATAYYEDQLSQKGFVFPDTIKLLETLHGRYRMYIVSNGGSNVQSGRLADSGIGKYCFGRRPEIKADETVIIGDSLTSDIQGGINAGIRTIWLNPDGQQAADIHPDYEVKTLMEIPTLLEEL